MEIVKMLKGPSSRISLEITPFHEGWFYFTVDEKKLYVDMTDEDGNQNRACINPDEAGGISRAIGTTLYGNSWANRRQAVAVEGLKKESNGIAGIAQDITDAQLEAAKNAELYICGQQDGVLTIAAYGDIPTCDIPIIVILLS